jgi:putative FmdB family regulatory protein
MPLYDYNCERCGTFEAQRHHTEAGSPAACPECGAEAARIWTAPVIAATGQPRTFNARRPTEAPKPLQPGSTAFRMPDSSPAPDDDDADATDDAAPAPASAPAADS